MGHWTEKFKRLVRGDKPQYVEDVLRQDGIKALQKAVGVFLVEYLPTLEHLAAAVEDQNTARRIVQTLKDAPGQLAQGGRTARKTRDLLGHLDFHRHLCVLSGEGYRVLSQEFDEITDSPRWKNAADNGDFERAMEILRVLGEHRAVIKGFEPVREAYCKASTRQEREHNLIRLLSL